MKKVVLASILTMAVVVAATYLYTGIIRITPHETNAANYSFWSRSFNGFTSRTSQRAQPTVKKTVTPPAPSTPAGNTVTPPAPSTPVAVSQPQSTPAQTLPGTPQTIKWGAYLSGGTADLAGFEAKAGQPLGIYAVFEDWGSSFPQSLSAKVGQAGKTLLIYWEPGFGYDMIINGSKDAYMKSFAAAAKAYGYPVIMVPFPEMNLNEGDWGYGKNGNTAAKFKSAWQRMRGFFTDAANVKFGIAFNDDSIPDVSGNQYADYYPGDGYVDYVGVDGFNFGSPWESFDSIFKDGLAKIAVYNKPVYIFATACAEGANKPAWITDAFTVAIKKYPKVAGWVWFNENKEENWLIDSSPASLTAFKNAVK